MVSGQRKAVGIHRGQRGLVLQGPRHADVPGQAGGVGDRGRSKPAIRPTVQGGPAPIPPSASWRAGGIPLGEGVSSPGRCALPLARGNGSSRISGDRVLGARNRAARRRCRARARREGGLNQKPGRRSELPRAIHREGEAEGASGGCGWRWAMVGEVARAPTGVARGHPLAGPQRRVQATGAAAYRPRVASLHRQAVPSPVSRWCIPRLRRKAHGDAE